MDFDLSADFRASRYDYKRVFVRPRNTRKFGPGIQALLVHRQTRLPHHLGNLYAAYAAELSIGLNTYKKKMEHCAAFLTWLERSPDESVAARVMQGSARIEDILSFKNWMIDDSEDPRGVTNTRAESINATSLGAKAFVKWLLLHSANQRSGLSPQLELMDRNWRTHAMLPTRTKRLAQDYDEDEIRKIEHFFSSRAFQNEKTKPQNGIRDYLIWRLAIEYGLRIGEILALRIQDIPSANKPYLEIVRSEHRENELDPRGAYAPKPKTLGRELGQYFENSRFPELFNIYRSSERWAWARRKSGRKYQKTSFAHPYLLISGTGAPLSMSSAQSTAQKATRATSIDFRWHRVRHTFFNRAYEEMLKIKDPHKRQLRLTGLVYLGGWSSQESLSIYATSAQRKSARSASYDLQKCLV